MNYKHIFNFSEPNTKSFKIRFSIIVLLFLSVLINFNARVYEKKVWDANPEIYYSDSAPYMSSQTTDELFAYDVAEHLNCSKT